MRKLLPHILSVIILSLFIFIAVGSDDEENTLHDAKSNTNSSSCSDFCRFLIEPGNSQWAIENEDACNKAISEKIGVSDWMKVNFSQDAHLSSKWDQMVNDCDL